MNIKTRLLKLEEQQAAKKVHAKPSTEWLAALIKSINEEKALEPHKASLSLFDNCRTMIDVVKLKEQEDSHVLKK